MEKPDERTDFREKAKPAVSRRRRDSVHVNDLQLIKFWCLVSPSLRSTYTSIPRYLLLVTFLGLVTSFP